MKELWRYYYKQQVFSKTDIYKDFFNDRPSRKDIFRINKEIYEEKEKRLIMSIGARRGLYYIVPLEENYKTYSCDPVLIATHLGPKAIICYSSALVYYGKAHSVLNIMYVSTEKRFRNLVYEGVRYKYVCLPYTDASIKKAHYSGNLVRVTSIERTLVDCLRETRYSGGLEELYQSYSGVRYINWMKIKKCLVLFKSSLLYVRLGFFLELFKKEWRIPEQFLNFLAKHKPSNPVYLMGRNQPGNRLVKKWNIFVPDGISVGGYNET